MVKIPNTEPPPREQCRIALLSEGLWDEAYALLKEKDAKLVDAYKTALLQESDPGSTKQCSETEINDRLKVINQSRLEEIQNSRVKINIAGREVDLKKSLRRSIETVLLVKDLVTTAVSSEFHASLAVIEGFEVDEDPQSSSIFTSTATEAKRTMGMLLRQDVVKFYAAILDYQIRLAKHFSRSGFFRALEDLGTTDDWQSMLETIKTLHDSVSGILRTIRPDMLQGSTNQEQLIKKLDAAQFAAFNAQSRERTNDVCLEGTQIQILREIRQWWDHPDGEVVYFLKGMAGTGKSTISRTLAAACHDRQSLVDGLPISDSTVLGGSFFFNERIMEQNHGGKFFATICKHLADSIPDFRDEKLVQTVILPLNLIVIVDALDECRAESDVSEIFRLIAGIEKLNSIRLRFFFTRRPEIYVVRFPRQFFQGRFLEMNLEKVMMPVDHLPLWLKNDIILFLEHDLTAISRHHGFNDKWPAQRQIQDLARKSDGLFIFAATACRFLAGPRLRGDEIKKRMSKILADKIEGDSPQQRLDSMYRNILHHALLEDALDDEKESRCDFFRQVVGSIVTLFDPLSTMALSDLLSQNSDTVLENLEALSSVLSLGEGKNSRIQLLHLSFRDFMLDKSRCGQEFWISETETHRILLSYWLDTLNNKLQNTLCQLSDFSTLKENLSAMQVAGAIPLHLQYACRFWVSHLLNSNQDVPCDVSPVYIFLEMHFLHWVEALSLMGHLGDGVKACMQLSDYISTARQRREKLHELLYNMKRFILTFNHIIGTAPLQTYASALLFSLKGSVIWKKFGFHVSDKITRLPMVNREESWSPLLQTLLDRDYAEHKETMDLAFSPDGRFVASSSVCVCDIMTGSLIRVFEPLGEDWAVSFSNSGNRVISTSRDGHLRVWSILSGLLELEAQTEEPERSAVQHFSHDKTLVVTLFESSRVRLFDISAGQMLRTFRPHSEPITDIAVSRDGKLLTTASEDQTVRLWCIGSGQLQAELRCDGKVHCVEFSVDCTQIISISKGENLKLWSTTSGELLHTMYDDFCDAKFTPDGKSLITNNNADPFAAAKDLILIWDVESHQRWRILDTRFPEHQVSPDGRYITNTPSCDQYYSDKKFRTREKSFDIWEVSTGNLHSSIENPSSFANKLSFSEDGTLLGCACLDGTVRLWDLTTKQSFTPLGPTSESSDIQNIQASSHGYVRVSYGSRFSLWSLKTGTLHKRVRGKPLPSRIHTDSNFFITTTFSEVKVWSSQTGDVVFRLEGHFPFVPISTFSQDQSLLVIGFGKESPIVETMFRGHLDRLGDEKLESTGKGSPSSESESEIVVIEEEDHSSFDSDKKQCHSSSQRDSEYRAFEGIVIEEDYESSSELNKTSSPPDDRLYNPGSGADSECNASMERSVIETDNEFYLAPARDKDELSYSGSEKFEYSDDSGAETPWFFRHLSASPEVQIWDLNTGKSLQIIKGDFQFVNAVSLSADGGFVAFIVAHSLPWQARRWELHVWDTRKDEQINMLESLESRIPIHLLWSPDSQNLAAVFKSDTIHLYEAMTGRLLTTLSTECLFSELAFSPDSRILASCGNDNAIQLWDLETSHIISKRPCDQPRNLRFSPYGKTLFTSAGRIDVRSFYPGQEALRDFDFLVEDDWVILGGKRVLWLPPDYIPTCVATTDDTIDG
ncbi:hypothetical protein N7488_004790 [Penicillium malachiteum]|nr:hypothetical protein N7488_004790 [Penicillium malachiteum]